MNNPIVGINWNEIEDDIDNDVWKRLTSFFWLPEKVALSNDIPSWNTLTKDEQDVVMKVFANLTVLDTLQGTVGAPTMMQHSRTKHEEAVFSYITFNEAVHAKSYSSIFTTLSNTEKIDNVFRWSTEDPRVQYKAQRVNDFYEKAQEADDAKSDLMSKAASVLLESFLFYSGFYVAFHWAANGKLTNTADIIRLILRDECLTAAHELLTPNGWKPISEVTEEDLVAQWREDGSIEFVHPVATSSHFAEKTYLFESAGELVRQHVSPGHRILTQRLVDGFYENEVTIAEEWVQPDYDENVYFISEDSLYGAHNVVKTELPGEQVYGVQVPSTYLLTRNNGSVTVTGNSIHGYYIGYKYQLGRAELSPAEQKELDKAVFDLADDLLYNEIKFTEDIYDKIGWTEDVKTYIRYNFNKALNNLGYDGRFEGEDVDVKPSILVQMAADIQDNQDFFSGSGSTYVVGVAEETTDDDWD